ncbi:MAG TPA: hypothetical protein VMF13_11905 [Luteitalea sp.]|nr:hypothetical protein [Luteitalea sp.]
MELPGPAVQGTASQGGFYALLDTGMVVGWDAASARPNTVVGLRDIVQIAANNTVVVALRRDGVVYEWASRGERPFTSPGEPSPPTVVSGLANIAQVATSARHGIALDRDGHVYTWGFNGAGQLGTGSSELTQPPTRVPGLDGITAIDAGLSSSFALTADGVLLAWGSNQSCMMGTGSRPGSEREPGGTQPTPTPIPGLKGVRAFDAGEGHVLAVLADGSVRAWGSNGYGQIGNNAAGYQMVPGRVPGLPKVVAVRTSGFRSFAVTAGGDIWHWGVRMPGDTASGGQRTPAVLLRAETPE